MSLSVASCARPYAESNDTRLAGRCRSTKHHAPTDESGSGSMHVRCGNQRDAMNRTNVQRIVGQGTRGRSSITSRLVSPAGGGLYSGSR